MIRRGIILLVLFISVSELSAQWLTGFTYRKKITIDHTQVAGTLDLFDFPFLYSNTDPDLKSTAHGGSVIHNEGWDIRFTSNDGSTLLDHEIDAYTDSTGELVVWIRLPLLSPLVDTDIYIYYGSSSVNTDPSTSLTWNSDYIGVWHLSENGKDSSPKSNNAIEYGFKTSAPGMVGSARYLDGHNDYLGIFNNSSLNLAESISIEAWVNIADISQTEWAILTKNFDYGLKYHHGKLVFDAGDLDLEYETTFDQDLWYYLSATYDGAIQRLYINGIEVNSFAHTAPISNDFSAQLAIGRFISNNAYDFNGILDEIKLSSEPHSSDWIKTSYNNQNRPDLFAEVSQDGLSNDFPCNAVVLPVYQTCSFQTFSNMDASDSGIPLSECAGYLGGDAWFKVEVPASGKLNVRIETDAVNRFPNNDGWAFWVGLAVYTGSCTSLTHDTCWIAPMAPGTPESPDIFLQGFNPGDTLFLRMWEGQNNDNGKFRICVQSDDEESPSIICPADLNHPTDPDSCVAFVSVPLPDVSDNMGIESLVNDYNGTDDASDTYPAGITLVTWTATDSAGNTATCSHTITVSDNQAPLISCMTDKTEYLDSICEFYLPDYKNLISVNDNCDPAPSVVQTPPPGTLLIGPGILQQIIISVEDSSGNISQCAFNITLQDTIRPTLSCQEDITDYLDSDCGFTVPDYGNLVIAADNCDTAFSITQTPPQGTRLTGASIQQISISVEDPGGNISQCQFNLLLADTISPVFECPDDLTQVLESNCEISLPDYTNQIPFYDNCDPVLTITQAPPPGTLISGSGTIQEIVLTARDQSGNRSECWFNVVVLDNSPPEAHSINDTLIVLEPGVYETFVSIPLPDFVDNCGIASVANDINAESEASGIYTYGTTTVTYTVSDINSNTAQFTQRVELRLNKEPTLGMIIPEAFSPNEDGLNDRFEILGIGQYPQNELYVYNVQGIEVFHMANYDNSWDGVPSRNLDPGRKLPTGTYYYILRLDRENTVLKGSIYLRRE